MRCIAAVLAAAALAACATSAGASLVSASLNVGDTPRTVTWDTDKADIYQAARDTVAGLGLDGDSASLDLNLRTVASTLDQAAGGTGDAVLGGEEAFRLQVQVPGGKGVVDFPVFAAEGIVGAARGFAARHALGDAAAAVLTATIARVNAQDTPLQPYMVYHTSMSVDGQDAGELVVFSNDLQQLGAVSASWVDSNMALEEPARTEQVQRIIDFLMQELPKLGEELELAQAHNLRGEAAAAQQRALQNSEAAAGEAGFTTVNLNLQGTQFPLTLPTAGDARPALESFCTAHMPLIQATLAEATPGTPPVDMSGCVSTLLTTVQSAMAA